MAGSRNPDGRSALAAIVVGCAIGAAAMLVPLGTLGDRERIALAAVTGIAAALAMVAGIAFRRWIAARPRQEDMDEEEPEAPALRREDVHPDAPPRRPIFAVSDLGMPEAEEEAIPALLERFEQGLARRTARTRPEADTEESPPDVDEALRDALGTLKQMASRVQ